MDPNYGYFRNAREVVSSGSTGLDLPFTKITAVSVAGKKGKGRSTGRRPRAVMAILVGDVVSQNWAFTVEMERHGWNQDILRR